LLKLADKFEEGLKGLFVPGIVFEELGFRYFGPFNGHDLVVLTQALKNILNLSGPRILHVVTKKGKGYSPAEQDPITFHSAPAFEIKTGKLKTKDASAKTYTEVFSNKLIELARENERIVAITAAMPEGTGLDRFRDLYPQRFFDVGIAEQHALCFASGLSRGGLKPVVAIYSTFLQRAYDQLITEVALQGTAIILAIDRAGIVGGDGPTHQGLFDIAYLRHIPNFVLMAPSCAEELEAMLGLALKLEQSVAIRYPKSPCPAQRNSVSPLELGKAEILKEGEDFLVVALGSMLNPCLEAIELLGQEGLSGSLINARFVKPLDADLLVRKAQGRKFIFSVEEGVLAGGFGEAMEGVLNRPVYKIGLPCEFISHGAREVLLEKYGLNARGILQRIKSVIAGRPVTPVAR
jgi:1-deoxy-D-xylulose-5-phosphate synthase